MWQSRQLLMGSLLLSLGLGTLPVQAQVSQPQVEAFVEALRQAAPQTNRQNDGLYSDWQIKPDNIPRWSKACIGRELSPTQFQESPGTARRVVLCIMEDVLKEEYQATRSNEALSIRRAAAWWMTGNPQQYDQAATAAYTQRVLNLYQSLRGASAQIQAPSQAQNSEYDRYMKAGYAATGKRDYATALLYFQRALDERPQDSYAQQALRNVERYQTGAPQPVTPAVPRTTASPTTPGATAPAPTTPTATSSVTTPSSPTVPSTPAPSIATPASTITEQQAIALVNRWLQAKSQIFAPPFDRQPITQLTTGELYTSLTKPDGVLNWLQTNQAYYRFGVQKLGKIERFVATRDKATLEISLTEDRTLYREGKVDPDQTDFETYLVRYNLERIDNQWKVADYKTVEGSTLERSVLETARN